MRFEEARAISFGPFKDALLTVAPGFNLVYGPNESGKSTWHAALYAGLCGRRRGRGRPTGEAKNSPTATSRGMRMNGRLP